MYNRWNIVLLGFIALLTIFSILVVWPGYPKRYLPDFIDYPEGPIITIAGREAMKLGLDLNGGTYVLLEADTAQLPPGTDIDGAMEGAKEVIERRINAVGIGETEVTREGQNRLAVQLPGISPDEAGRLIGRTALLEFREPERDAGNIVCRTPEGAEFSVPLEQVADTVNEQGQRESRCLGAAGESGAVVWTAASARDSQGETRVLTGRFINPNSPEVQTGFAECIPACVAFSFTSEGGLLFEEITTRLVGYPLGIFLDDELVGSPTVRGPITGGNTYITGLSTEDATRLRIQLNTGALPVAMREVQKQEVDATLGENVLVRTVQAGLVGILAVMAFMILYYRVPGLLASLALVTYGSVMMMIFKLFPGEPVTVTLAGIAAFVLSVGMAVDGNILVFERMKEELRSGRSLASSIEHGFDRAWSSIRDSNVSTLITTLILWWFGDQFDAALVKGFAVTLGIGVVLSMFSAIVVTRTFLRLMVGSPLAQNLRLFAPDLDKGVATGPTPQRRFVLDFVRRRGFYFALSALILLPGIMSLAVPPSLKAGIEFSSGATFTVQFANEAVTQAQVRDAMRDMGFPEARVQRTGAGAYIIRVSELEAPPGPPIGPAPPGRADEVRDGLIGRFGPMVNAEREETNAFQNFNAVSEIVSREIARNAAIAVGAAAIAILLFISWSFRNVPKAYRYGIAAVVAAGHDALFIVGAFSIFGKLFGTEINTMFITGILTIIGFSVHDTIVVFDRIRENVSKYPEVAFGEVVNASLTETIGRSLNTSFTLLVTVMALLVLGAGGVDALLVAMALGIVAGSYSSIFLAVQLLVAWEEGDFVRTWRRIWPGRRVPAEAAG
jgi:protein-export membrane protein SecD/preprotein translocase SecF subunit